MFFVKEDVQREVGTVFYLFKENSRPRLPRIPDAPARVLRALLQVSARISGAPAKYRQYQRTIREFFKTLHSEYRGLDTSGDTCESIYSITARALATLRISIEGSRCSAYPRSLFSPRSPIVSRVAKAPDTFDGSSEKSHHDFRELSARVSRALSKSRIDISKSTHVENFLESSSRGLSKGSTSPTLTC